MLRRIVLLFACSISLMACMPDVPEEASSGSVGPISFEKATFAQSGGPQCPDKPDTTPENMHCATVKLDYPTIVKASTPEAAKQLNQFILQQLLDYTDANDQQPSTPADLAKLFIADYEQSPEATGTWELDRKVSIVFGNDKLLTLHYQEQGNAGGPQPFSGQRYLVINSQTGQQLTLADLLVANFKDQLNAIGERAFRRANNIPPNSNLDMAGFTFENNVFRLNTNFGVTEEGLLFVFNPYEIGADATTTSEFLIPYPDIKPLIPPTSPLAALAP